MVLRYKQRSRCHTIPNHFKETLQIFSKQNNEPLIKIQSFLDLGVNETKTLVTLGDFQFNVASKPKY